MRELITAGMVFVVLAVALVIGTAIVVQTQNVTTTLVGSSTLLTNMVTYTGNGLTTFASLLPIVALAIVGGIALFYVMGFIGGGRSE